MSERRGASAEREARAAAGLAAQLDERGQAEAAALHRARAAQAERDAFTTLMVGADLPDLIPPRPRWHADAACRGRGDWFDLAAPDAKAICGECPVKQACADDGIEEPAGVWGGMSERDRRKLRRGRVA